MSPKMPLQISGIDQLAEVINDFKLFVRKFFICNTYYGFIGFTGICREFCRNELFKFMYQQKSP